MGGPGIAGVLVAAGVITCALLLVWLCAEALGHLARTHRGANRPAGRPVPWRGLVPARVRPDAERDGRQAHDEAEGLGAYVALVRAIAEAAPRRTHEGTFADEIRSLALDLAEKLERPDEEIEALRASLSPDPSGLPAMAGPPGAVERLRGILAGITAGRETDPAAPDATSGGRLLFVSFEREIRDAERSRTPLSLMDLRVEGFETIEERFGRAATDRILRGVARAIRSQLRPGDTCVRDAGGSFLVLVPGVPAEAVVPLAARIEAAVSRHKFAPERGRTIRLEASICAATFPRDGGSYDALITAARARRALKQPASSPREGVPAGLRPYPNRIDAPVN